MKKFNKTQISIIAALSAALILLCCGITAKRLINRNLNGDENESPPANAETEYQRIRDARISLSPSILLETTLGGSNDETLNAVFALDDKLYIFGSTTSSDYDMDAAGVFMAVLNNRGRTEAFYFPAAGQTLEKVILAEGGFLLGLSGSTPTLMLLDTTGKVLNTKHIGKQQHEQIVDLKLEEGGYTVVTRYSSSAFSVAAICLLRFDFALNLTYERLISAAFSLNYLDCFTLNNESIVFFNARGDLAAYLGTAVCGVSLTPKVNYCTAITGYRADAVVPYPYGYALSVTFDDGRGGLLFLNGNRVYVDHCFTGVENVKNTALYYSNSVYYAYFYGDNNEMTAFTTDFLSGKKATQFDGTTSVDSIYAGADFLLFAALRDGRVTVLSANGVYSATVNSTTQKNARLCLLSTGIFVITESVGADGDCADSFGGSDIWVAQLCD